MTARTEHTAKPWRVIYGDTRVWLKDGDGIEIVSSRDSSKGAAYAVIAAAMNVRASLYAEIDALRAERDALREALERITDSHARLELERGSVVGTLTANARAALARGRT